MLSLKWLGSLFGVTLLTACGASIGPPASSASPCNDEATVTFTVPGGSPVALTSTSKETVTVKVGQPIAFTFSGPCAAGGSLYVNPTPETDTGYTDVWVGQPTGTWTATSPGTRALMPTWSCLGVASCRLEPLGVLVVKSPA